MNGTVSELAIIALWGACCAAFGVILGWWAVVLILIGSVLIATLSYQADL